VAGMKKTNDHAEPKMSNAKKRKKRNVRQISVCQSCLINYKRYALIQKAV